MDCPIKCARVIGDTQNNRMRVIVGLMGCKDDQGCAVVYDDREILEAIDGDGSLVRVVF